MPDRCVPPPNTPAGTVCVLSRITGLESTFEWTEHGWRVMRGCAVVGIDQATIRGWRFVRVVEGRQ